MPNHDHANVNPPARTHAEAAALLRRPFAPGAIGFRAMTKVTYNGEPYARRAGRRLPRRPIGRPAAERGRPRPLAPAVPDAPGRARPDRQPAGVPRVPADRHPPRRGGRPRRRRRLRGRRRDGRRLVRRAEGALLRRAQARRRRRRDRRLPVHVARAGRAADRPAATGRCRRSAGRARPTCSSLSPATEQWLRHGYETRMNTDAVRRDLGEILAHGEPETGMGQGEVADQAAQPTGEPARRRAGQRRRATATARS